MVSQEDLLGFITQKQNPVVSLADLNKQYGSDQRETIRMHLGALYRGELIDRQNGSDGTVAYWTVSNAANAIKAGFKSSRAVSTKPAEVQPAKFGFPSVGGKDPLALVAQPPIPESVPYREVAKSEEPAARPNSRAPHGSLRRASLTGIVGLAMFYHKPGAFTLEQVSEMLPGQPREKLLIVLNQLFTKDYLDRTQTRPYKWSWSVRYCYPCSSQEPDDYRLFKQLSAAVIAANSAAEEIREVADEMSREEASVAVEKVVSQVAATNNTSAEEVVKQIVDTEEEESDDEEEDGDDEGQQEEAQEEVEETQEAETVSDSEVETKIKEPSVEAQLDSFDTVQSIVRTGKVVETFDAALNLEGELTLVNDNVIHSLTKEQTLKLIRLLGPHFNPSEHVLF